MLRYGQVDDEAQHCLLCSPRVTFSWTGHLHQSAAVTHRLSLALPSALGVSLQAHGKYRDGTTLLSSSLCNSQENQSAAFAKLTAECAGICNRYEIERLPAQPLTDLLMHLDILILLGATLRSVIMFRLRHHQRV